MSNSLIFPKGFRINLSFFLPHQKVSLDFNRLTRTFEDNLRKIDDYHIHWRVFFLTVNRLTWLIRKETQVSRTGE